MADTALTLITDALLDLGVLADEETPTSSQAVGALRKLNNMIDSWNLEKLMVYGANSYILPLVNGQSSYTIGSGGNLNIPRPVNIESAYLRDLTAPAGNRLDIPLYTYTDQEWQDVAFKGQTSTYPFGVWFDRASPLIRAYVTPVPTSSQYSIVLWTSGVISNLALNDAITLAPGYKRALTANLVIELAPSYGVEPSAAIIQIAQDSKKNLKIKNIQMDELSLPAGLSSGNFNILTGWMQ